MLELQVLEIVTGGVSGDHGGALKSCQRCIKLNLVGSMQLVEGVKTDDRCSHSFILIWKRSFQTSFKEEGTKMKRSVKWLFWWPQ